MRSVLTLILAGVLVAPASFAQRLGDETGRMGGETGFFVSGAPGVTITITATPFARTVTCTGAITLTGTAPGTGAVTWAASPDGASGACTGTTSWSCAVAVAPNAAGEGLETITITQGAFAKSVDVGFYVSGAHSCFLSQSYDGAYNAGKANLDAVATWKNLGSSARDVTQATGSAQPTYRTSIVGGQPVVRCDGGDNLAASTANDWNFLHNGVDWTVDETSATTEADPNKIQVVVATTDTSSPGDVGVFLARDDRTGSSRFDRLSTFLTSGAAYIIYDATSADNAAPQQKYIGTQWTLDDGGATEFAVYVNGSSTLTQVSVTGYGAVPASHPIGVCSAPGFQFYLTGDLFRILIYTSALDATQRGINKAVDEWALGGTLPVTP